jgi:hypothetical protein
MIFNGRMAGSFRKRGMIVDIFVRQRDGVNVLGDEVLLPMRDKFQTSGIDDDMIDASGEFDF